MDAEIATEESSAKAEEKNEFDTQINPLTIMTSVPPFTPVDVEQENALASSNIQVPDLLVRPALEGEVASTPLNRHMDNRSIAAWVESTTTENASPTLERSPSLPSTLQESMSTQSRRNSTVSTLCDQQQSILSDTISSQQVSYTNEMMRSLSVPTNAQFDNNNEPIPFVNDDDDEDMSNKFLPVPESEESEVEKKAEKPSAIEKQSPVEKKHEISPVVDDMETTFESRSPKRSPNITFHSSVSFEAPRRPCIPSRRRRISWNNTTNKSPSLRRSLSHIVTPPKPSLHSQILRKQFYNTAHSMPTGTHHSSSDATRQSSNLSDNVFHSVSTTNSSSIPSHPHSSKEMRFLPILSSASALSSDQHLSNISDASGRSGIESTNLDTTPSDQFHGLSIDDGETPERRPAHLPQLRNSSTSSATPSTQSLTTSSDEEMHDFNQKMTNLQVDHGKRKAPQDKRRDILKQLMWLLEKKPTIYGRFGFGNRKSISPVRQQTHQKSTQKQSVELRSSFRSNNVTLRNESDTASKPSTRLFSSSNEQSHLLHALPLYSQTSYVDPMSQSYSSVRSAHSDSSATTSLINSKPSSRHVSTNTISLSSSLHFPRRRPHHRRNLTGFAAITRDRKNSFNKSDQQTTPQEDSPLIRNIEAILNEHLTMIQQFLSKYPLNATLPYSSQSLSVRDLLYTRLNELSQQTAMNQRCSRIETKEFIDSIRDFQLNRAHHYSFLNDSIHKLFVSNNHTPHFSNRHSDNEDEKIKDGHMASNESSNTSSPSLARYLSMESQCEVNVDELSFTDNPLRFFRILSKEYLSDCERTESELTKIFDLADQQHILYCLKHVSSGHNNDMLGTFHRRLDALFVWYNLYYELTISVKKLSGLLRCDDCEDWPKLRFRSIATNRERKAKRAHEDDADYDWTSEESEDDEEVNNEPACEDESDVESEFDAADESDILPKSSWPEEAPDSFSRLEIPNDVPTNESNPRVPRYNRIGCYRNFVYYMDKRSYQVKYDGLARTLIERVAPVLAKTRLALLQTSDRAKIKTEEVLAGLSLHDLSASNTNKCQTTRNPNEDETDDQLVDTDNPMNDDSSINVNIGDLTIEKWLCHILKSCSTIKTICSSTDDILQENWLELHQQLGLPSLLPLYFFVINVLLDVMNECLRLYNKPHMNNDTKEIDSLCRQQLVREAKLVLRDALATRLYSVRMMEQFFSHRKIISELVEFDENIVKLYTQYKQFLSTVCINRTFSPRDDENMTMNDETNTDLYYYVDEETSELIKEYYFARDLTVTLGNRTEIRDLCIDFSNLTQRILVQLKEELNGKTEKYYQTFAIDMTDTLKTHDGSYSADVISESTKAVSFHSSASVPNNLFNAESPVCDAPPSFSEQKKNDIIASTREFRRDFDTIKQRATRVCNLAKTLNDDFSIAAEFKCLNHTDLWQQLQRNSYTQIKISFDARVNNDALSHTSVLPSNYDTDDFDNFYVFVPPWLSTEKIQVEKLLSSICTQQNSSDESNKTSVQTPPAYMVFLPKGRFSRSNLLWKGEILRTQPSESTKLALNSTEICSFHLIVNRSDHWQNAVNLFQSHAGLTNLQLIRKLPRDEGIRSTLDQLPGHIERLSLELTDLVRTLNTIWDQDSTRIYLTEVVKFDERRIESNLVDLVLYVYNSGFDLFRLLYDLIPIRSDDDEGLFTKFISTMNEFFCEWCKCVTKKFKYTSIQQARTAKYKVSKPRWLAHGIFFLRLLAKSSHLQVLSEDDYKKLTKEMPVALDAFCRNAKSNSNSPITKARSNSVSSTPGNLGRPRNSSNPNSGHRRYGSGGRYTELMTTNPISPRERIILKIKNLENHLEKRFRDRKQIGQIFNNTATTAVTVTPDPVGSLKMRNIDFQWRRGTRIGQGGAGVAFRAINCSNGSIVCMKEIQLSSIASRSLPSTYPEKLRGIAQEINMIMNINHPNIVRYFGIEKYKRTIYICMEYCLSTVNEFLNDIRSFQKRASSKRKNSVLCNESSDNDEDLNVDSLRLNSSLDVNENVRGFVGQLLQALMALHEHSIVHCDVKGDNIFIANDHGKYIVKLGDFNLSHRLELESPSANGSDSRSTQKGTIYFKPPEPEYVYKSDIWALGCTIIEMLTGKLPWTNVTRPPDDQIYIQNQLLAKKGPPIPDELKAEKEACEFIESCLKPDLDNRPTARELLNYPYARVRMD